MSGIKIKDITKTVILLLFIVASTKIAKGNIEWEKTFGGSEWDYGYYVQQTTDGGYIIAGQTRFLETDPNKTGFVDNIFLIKTDTQGNTLWERTFEDSRPGIGNCVQQTTDGGYIITGTKDEHKVYLIKTDSNGETLWEKTLVGGDRYYGHSVQQTTDGGYIVTGLKHIFVETGIYPTKEDVYLIKTDSNGNMLWEKTIGGSDSDMGNCVQQTSDGGYIILGSTYSYGAGNEDVYLIKTDPNGNTLWERTFGSSEWDFATSIQQTSDGGYIIAGDIRHINYNVSDPDEYIFYCGFYLIKTDSNGEKIWEKTFEGDNSYSDYITSAQQTTDGGYIIANSKEPYGAGESDIYIMKTDSNCEKIWEMTVGGIDDDMGKSIQQTTDGGYIIAGSTYSYRAGKSDVYLVKLSSDTAAGKIIYVDDNANGLNNGSSWENAYIHLQDAFTDAYNSARPLEIRAAQGTYTPDQGDGHTPGDRESAFNIRNGINLIGGYAGWGVDDPNERNIELYQTILSGDLDGNDVNVNEPNDLPDEPTRNENSYHVVISSRTDQTAILDGFTITSGNANGPRVSEGRSLTDDERYFLQFGAGMYCVNSNLIVTNCTFSGNVGNKGGGMYSSYGNPTLTNCIFIGNSANYGGGLFNINDSNSIMENCTFSGNVAYTRGGGIYNEHSSSILSNCTFSENEADYGGGIFNIYDSNSIMDNCTFSGNTTKYRGGGIYNERSNAIISNCTFSENEADYGGGILNEGFYDYYFYDYEYNLILDNCTFSRNTVNNSGGGIYNNENSLMVSNCTFSENEANYGGGMYNNVFYHNNYNYDGSNSILTDCTFVDNLSRLDGGGIYNRIDSQDMIVNSLTLNNCIFRGNIAEDNGGGIFSFKQYSEFNIEINNCIFSNNSAKKYGGAFHNYYHADANFANCTFAENLSAHGNSIACTSGSSSEISGGNIELTNCILWDDSSIWNDNGSLIFLTYNNVKGGQSSVYAKYGQIVWLQGIINRNPLFVNPGYWVDVNDPNIVVKPNDPNSVWIDGDYHLKSQVGRWDPNSQTWVLDDVTSPCIDAGDPNSPIGDEPEPNGWVINMGAYGGTEEASMSPPWQLHPLSKASNPYPSDDAINIVANPVLSWTTGSGVVLHDVYFGTDFSNVNDANLIEPLDVLKSVSQDYTFYDPGLLEPNTMYYWRIDEVNDSGFIATGNVWRFKTDVLFTDASNPNPANGAIDVFPNVILSWDSGQNAITHDVYFGTDFNDVKEATLENPIGMLVSAGIDSNSYNPPGNLLSNQIYYWRIDETDSYGITTKGEVWMFKTIKSKSRGCFTGQTLVWIDGKTMEISKAVTGQTTSINDKIKQLQVHDETWVLFDILLESGNNITVADDHYFMTESGKWMSLHNLKAGMKLKTSKDSVEIKSIEKNPIPFAGKVYNLKIKGSDQYMVGIDAVIVRDF